MSKYFSCPNCGADVPTKAKACPECGSDEDTGWSEEAKYVHLLPNRGDSALPRSKGWQKYLMAAIASLVVTSILISQGFAWGIYFPLIILGLYLSYFVVQKIK
jgi:uncharacterized membrane protein YvbJ